MAAEIIIAFHKKTISKKETSSSQIHHVICKQVSFIIIHMDLASYSTHARTHTHIYNPLPIISLLQVQFTHIDLHSQTLWQG